MANIRKRLTVIIKQMKKDFVRVKYSKSSSIYPDRFLEYKGVKFEKDGVYNTWQCKGESIGWINTMRLDDILSDKRQEIINNQVMDSIGDLSDKLLKDEEMRVEGDGRLSILPGNEILREK